MLKTTVPLCVCAAALALGACGEADTNNAATAQPEAAQEAAGDQTIAASLDQNSRFFQAARAVGLDATLAGPGPYTVLVSSDEAFAQVEGGILNDHASPQNRAEITRILTYHILPGVILAEDLRTAIGNADGTAVLATMGGETVNATMDGDAIVIADAGSAQARITEADVRASNGVVHRIDTVLMPPERGANSDNQQSGQ